MKTRISLILVAVLLFSLTACGTSTQFNSETPSISPQGSSSQNADSTSPDTSDATITETVLLDEAGIKITAKSLNADSLFGPELKILIENNSGQDLTFQTRNESINGYMVDCMLSEDVVNGKKSNTSITFMESDLDACGIETIADISFNFHIFTSSDWETFLDSDVIEIKTSAAETYAYTFDDSGEVAYDNNDIKIVVKGVTTDDILGPGIIVYIENNRQQNITVQTRDVSINGFMIDAIFSSDIVSEKHSIDTITFYSSDLEENEITNIESAELSFYIFDSDSWKDIAESEVITIEF